ncbi:MAG: DUF393 domain-containing protein [Granulosicoccus sp.]|nr:DUF393 domain-containing protein [Granulosicoccus sp.]
MSETSSSLPQLTVYYDGSCPLCQREIGFFKKREEPGKVNWIDICASSDQALGENLTRCDAMARFTVRNADGTLLSGAAAFSEMWKVTPGFKWLGNIAQFRPIQIALDNVYLGFLKIRPSIQKMMVKNQ